MTIWVYLEIIILSKICQMEKVLAQVRGLPDETL